MGVGGFLEIGSANCLKVNKDTKTIGKRTDYTTLMQGTPITGVIDSVNYHDHVVKAKAQSIECLPIEGSNIGSYSRAKALATDIKGAKSAQMIDSYTAQMDGFKTQLDQLKGYIDSSSAALKKVTTGLQSKKTKDKNDELKKKTDSEAKMQEEAAKEVKKMKVQKMFKAVFAVSWELAGHKAVTTVELDAEIIAHGRHVPF